MPTNPNSNSELIVLHAWEDNPIYLKCVQGESGIKIAKFQLVDDNGAINLTGNTGIVFMGTSGDGSAVSVNCTVDSATDGKVSLSASTNFTSAIGNTKGNIVVNFSNNQNIQFDGITIKVSPNKAIEALIHDDTFATFLSALSKLQNMAANTFVEVSNPTGNPKNQHYYEIVNNSYVLSNDTTVDANKTYYYSESRTLTTIDNALDENSTNPVQNSAIATAINNIINSLDNYMNTASANSLDDCTAPNTVYKVYVDTSRQPDWTWTGGYQKVFVSGGGAYIAQFILGDMGGLITRYKSLGGNWSSFKSFALSGDTLAAYGITDAYTKSEVYNKDEVDGKVGELSGTVAQNKADVEGRVTTLESAVSGNTSSIGTLSNVVGGNSNRLIALENSIINKMPKDFLSVTSFMCDEDGTIFAATDDTVLTSHSFENQDKTSTPYFIWIAKTVTEVEDNAFVNTGKIAKIYCETSSADTPLPSAYQSLPIEYGINNLFLFYILRSLVTLYNDKVNKSDVYTADTADSTFERVSNKSDTFGFDTTPTAAERLLFPTVARMKEFAHGTFYEIDEVDNLVATINQAIATKANSSDVYTQSQIREMITVLENLCDELGDQISARLRNINDVIKTNHITDGNVTEQKLSADVQAKLNKNTGIYSYIIPANGWNNNAQTLDLSSVYTVTNNTKVDTEGDSTVIEQLVIDDCGGIYVENNNGTLTIKAIGNVPTANIVVQFVVYEVESLD